MTTPNIKLMSNAWDKLSGKWGTAIAGFLVYFLTIIIISIIPKIGNFITLIVGGPFAFGVAAFFLRLARDQESDINLIFSGFRNKFSQSLSAYLMVLVYVFPWTLLCVLPGTISYVLHVEYWGYIAFAGIPFIIPAIIVSLNYSQVYYILSDNDTLPTMDLLRKSKAMMFGHRLKYIGIGLLFGLFIILSAATLFIGLIWLLPWMQLTLAFFYEDIREKEEGEIITATEEEI